jgi:Prokaryotic N-terminal methylation motif
MSTLCCSRRLRLPRRFQGKASGPAATPVWQRIRAVRQEAFTLIELLVVIAIHCHSRRHVVPVRVV